MKYIGRLKSWAWRLRVQFAEWLIGDDLSELRSSLDFLRERMDNFPAEIRSPTADVWNAITDSNRQMNRIEYKLKQFNKRIEKLEGLEKYPNPPISSMFGQDPE